ncbi:hypothetical protein H7B90_14740 [Cohnella xylanilytica]|uniref:Spore germination protein GerPC n=1 Tax=Cohnella xylanilytica TaxID=557555 RepID=A0A841U3V1_9BACL|nr:hypothetical protein [Cohnella xylanilytica]MBB6692664.1 hypothetical protein [Cohnella xylanilytica]
MRRPFRKRRKEERKVLEEVDGKFKELDARFARVEEALAQIKDKLPQVIIEHVVIERPVLEKLEFRFDGLEIEHLSGSLNLGNNFGLKPNVPKDSGSSAPPKPKPPSGAGPANGETAASPTGLHRTPTGFRLQNRR